LVVQGDAGLGLGEHLGEQARAVEHREVGADDLHAVTIALAGLQKRLKVLIGQLTPGRLQVHLAHRQAQIPRPRRGGGLLSIGDSAKKQPKEAHSASQRTLKSAP
jgi:hypothetical protein